MSPSVGLILAALAVSRGAVAECLIPSKIAAGWRPSGGEVDRYGREVDEEYGTKDFERVVALRARTEEEAISRHLTDFLKNSDRFGKTIVFCVDQEHASEMRRPPRFFA